jgi:hydrogenase maturation protease
MMKRSVKKVVVIGLGNVLLQDDGIGVRVIEQLRTQNFPKNLDVQFIDAGLTPDLTVFIDKAVTKLVIIDAAETGGAPGEVRTINPFDIRIDVGSIHGIDLKQNIELMRLSDVLPESIVIVGVEPGDMSPGMDLTEKIKMSLPAILESVRKTILS